jgi:hypothetical protein
MHARRWESHTWNLSPGPGGGTGMRAEVCARCARAHHTCACARPRLIAAREARSMPSLSRVSTPASACVQESCQPCAHVWACAKQEPCHFARRATTGNTRVGSQAACQRRKSLRRKALAALWALSGFVRLFAFCPISCILHDSRHAARKVRATASERRNPLQRNSLRRRHGALARFSPRCRVDRRRSRAIPGGALPLATGHRPHTRWRSASLAEP